MKRDENLLVLRESPSDFLIYQTEGRATKIEVRLEDETVWLTQRLMEELFRKDVRTINDHISTVYEEGELTPEATIRKYRIIHREGDREGARMMEQNKMPWAITDRTCYEVNLEAGLFEPEYVNIFGVPFTFLPHEGGQDGPHPSPTRLTTTIFPYYRTFHSGFRSPTSNRHVRCTT